MLYALRSNAFTVGSKHYRLLKVLHAANNKSALKYMMKFGNMHK